jgi:hypothetical protein
VAYSLTAPSMLPIRLHGTRLPLVCSRTSYPSESRLSLPHTSQLMKRRSWV